MEIKDEIEKCIKEVRDAGPALEDWEYHKRYADEVVGVHDGTIHGLGLAFSIVDKWECVLEKRFYDVAEIRIAGVVPRDVGPTIKLNPRDHILILRRSDGKAG